MTPPTLRPLAAILRDAAGRRGLAAGAMGDRWIVRSSSVQVAGPDGNPAPRTGMRPAGDTFPRVVSGANHGTTLEHIAANDPARVRQACEDVEALVALVEEMAEVLGRISRDLVRPHHVSPGPCNCARCVAKLALAAYTAAKEPA